MFTPSQGIAALEKIMTSRYTQVGVSEASDWNIVKSVFSQGHYLDEMKFENQNDVSGLDKFDHLVDEIKQATSLEERQIRIQIYMDAVLKHTLGLPPTDVLDIDQNLGEMGMDSLMGMEMKNRFQAMLGQRTLAISSMQENRTIRSLSAYIANLMDNQPLVHRPFEELIAEDSVLPAAICPSENSVSGTKPSEYKHIFFTGATGYLGAHTLFQLLKSRPDLMIHCLVRGNSDADALEKLQKAFIRYRIEFMNLEKVRVIAGDITKERLMLDIDTYSKLSEEIDAIIHFAARVNHVDKYSDGSEHDMRNHNVMGLVNILRFASSGRTKSILFASTLFATTKLSESGLISEEYPDKEDMGDKIRWGYLQSKFTCEKLCGEALQRGIPVTTIRYPVILGHSVTGFMPTGYNHVWATVLASVRVHMVPKERLNGIPIIAVDSAAKVTTYLFLSDRAEIGMYNMTVASTMSEEILHDGLGEFGMSCEFVPSEEWRDAVFEDQAPALMGPLKSLYMDEKLDFYSLHAYSGEIENINISNFSSKMTKNVPGIEKHVPPASSILRRMLRAHYKEKYPDYPPEAE